MSGKRISQQGWSRDPDSFNTSYRDDAPRLRAFLQQMVGSRQVAEDLTQEIFIELWRRPAAYDPMRGSLRAYLFGIGRHRAADWWRQHRSEEVLEDDRCAACNPERESVMGDALRRLPEDQRTLLWLREVEGQSYTELAAILEIPVGTVRSRLFAARAALRTIWLGAGQERRLHEVR